VRVLLDTHIFIALARRSGEPELACRKIVEDEENDLLISAISIAEIAIKSTTNKLEINTLDTVKATEDLRLSSRTMQFGCAICLCTIAIHLTACSLRQRCPRTLSRKRRH